jgi:hypothetical protein
VQSAAGSSSFLKFSFPTFNINLMKIYSVVGYYYPESSVSFSYHISKDSAQRKADDMNNSLQYLNDLKERIYDSFGHEEFEDPDYYTEYTLYSPISTEPEVHELELEA